MYTPPQTVMSADIPSTKQRRVLLMGPPGWGKTWSAVKTFPSPYVIDFDKGLSDVKQNIPGMTLYDDEYCKKFFPGKRKANIVVDFLRNEAPKFSSEQTIIFDSLSTLGDAVAADLKAVTPLGKDGQMDGFKFWDLWGNWLLDFHTMLAKLQCTIVVCCHEQEIRDSETGRVIGYKWNLAGEKFSNRLGQFYTDCIRQTRVSKDNPDKTVTHTYSWQVQADSLFPLCKTRVSTNQKFVTADYKSLVS